MSDVTSDAGDDLVLPIQIEGVNVRGRIVRLGAVAERVIAGHSYPEAVSRVVGEALALAALLGTALKFDGIFTVQLSGKGALRMVVADYRGDAEGAPGGAVRALASFDADAVARLPDQASFRALLGDGALAMTIDPGGEMERYQGIVDLEGESLAEAAESYFLRSEQIPTRIRLAVGRIYAEGRQSWRAGGILLQQLAADGGVNAQTGEDIAITWERLTILHRTVEDHELLDPSLEPERLAFRLFNEDGVRVFARQTIRFACRCSRERVGNILKSYSEDELTDLVDDGEIRVTCEFCSTRYAFTPEELAEERARS